MRYALIGLALRTISSTGIDRIGGKRFAGIGVILTFHHVRVASDRVFPQNALLEVTPAYLEAVLRLLADLDYEIIPIDHVKSRIEEPRGKPFAVITFDDGYIDNRDYAMPILKRYEAPFTVFVTPGFLDRTTPLWWLDLEDALRDRDEIDVMLPHTRFRHVTRTPKEKQAGFARFYWELRGLSEFQVREIVATLAAEAGVDTIGRVARLCMDWPMLKDFAREPLVTIGAHTNTHPRLKTLTEDQSREEIFTSKSRIEQELQREVKHFAYPVGDPTSAGRREFAFAAEAGCVTGVTTRPGVVFPEHAGHLHALPRISVNGLFQNPDYLRALIAGLPLMLRNRGRRLNVD
jgi:peptidoglycan/xylan/chitin deacetylase (PgdA/CDA1 family)